MFTFYALNMGKHVFLPFFFFTCPVGKQIFFDLSAPAVTVILHFIMKMSLLKYLAKIY